MGKISLYTSDLLSCTGAPSIVIWPKGIYTAFPSSHASDIPTILARLGSKLVVSKSRAKFFSLYFFYAVVERI